MSIRRPKTRERLKPASGARLAVPGRVGGPDAVGHLDGLGLRVDAELAQDALDVGAHGVARDDQAVGDLVDRQAGAEQVEDLPLARGQAAAYRANAEAAVGQRAQ